MVLAEPLDIVTRSLPAMAAPATCLREEVRAAHEPSDASDAALVVRAAAGDSTAEAALYRAHAPSVLRLAMRLLRSKEEALDVLQDTFVLGFEKLGSLREPERFRAWILTVAARLVHRRFRREKLLAAFGLGRRQEALICLEDLASDAASAEARAELRWLDRALSAVDDRARVVWMLRHVEQLELTQIADASQCSLATVKRRLAVAEEAVEKHFADPADIRGGGR